jgi:hypothetical protein
MFNDKGQKFQGHISRIFWQYKFLNFVVYVSVKKYFIL